MITKVVIIDLEIDIDGIIVIIIQNIYISNNNNTKEINLISLVSIMGQTQPSCNKKKKKNTIQNK